MKGQPIEMFKHWNKSLRPKMWEAVKASPRGCRSITSLVIGCVRTEPVEGPPYLSAGGRGLTYAQGPHARCEKKIFII